MKIGFYCKMGTSSFIFTPETIWQRGVGGAELGFITLTEALAARGHDVTVFNPCPAPGMYGDVRYRPSDDLASILGTPWDVFVLFRNPAPQEVLSRLQARRRIFFSCDQVTEGDYARDIFPFVDHAVAISPYHRQYLSDRYKVPVERITAIDLPVRTGEYRPEEPLPQKVRNRLIFCSIPDRGLEHLAVLFPRIRASVPDAELVITSDYTLWGEGIPPLNERFRQMFQGMPGVTFLGKVPRPELVQLQLSADVLAYPNQPVAGNCELFGISVAECQAAGAVPVISTYGAFPTTVINGCLLDGDPSTEPYRGLFERHVVELLRDRRTLAERQAWLRRAALDRFAPGRIATLWESVLSA